MNPIRTNKPVFFGDDGEVLKSGNIYIGQPSQWPLSFPKTVTLQDSAGSQFTAAQPLRTNSQGRIEYNGKAVIALVDGDYSMLVRDRNGVTVADGYTPFVENSSTGAVAEDVTRVGLTLSDIKQFDVTPGDTVRNVGKTTSSDKMGADWLVVTSTGTSANDETIIDFTNGTQGRLIERFGPRTVWTGDSATVDITDFDINDRGTGRYIVYVETTCAEIEITTNGSFFRSLLDCEAGAEFMSFSAVRYSAFSGSFSAIKFEVSDLSTAPAGSETALNITRIEKI